MSITLKRLFTALIALGMLGIGAALAAGNTLPNTNSFETVDGWVATLVNGQNNWTGIVDDVSVVTNGVDLTFTAPCGYPLAYTHDTASHVLQLNTGNGVLTNVFDDIGISNNIVFIDTMVQIVVQDEGYTPSVCTPYDSEVKLAVYANANSNLVVYHGVLASGAAGSWLSNQVTVIDKKIDSAQWYRLTVAFDATLPSPGDNADAQMFKVYLNGKAIVNGNAYANDWKTLWPAPEGVPFPSPSGTWFPSATATAPKTLRGVAFKGKGYIDDLVVSTNDPTLSFPPSTWFLKVVTAGSSGTVVPGVGTYEMPVDAGTNVVATADEWYRIQDMTTNGTSVATGLKTHNATIAAMAGDTTNTVEVTFYQPTSLGGVFGTIPTAWLSQWGTEAQVAVDDNDSYNLTNEYLLHMSPVISNTVSFTVDAIVRTGSVLNATAKLLVADNGGPLSVHQAIWGKLGLYTRTNLVSGADWELYGSTQNDPPGGFVFDANGKYLFSVTDPAYINRTNQFLKFEIEPR